MQDPSNAIESALYTLLNNTITVTKVTGSGTDTVPFYTSVPNGASYPYIYLNQLNPQDATDKNAFALSFTMVLDVVSGGWDGDTSSNKQANSISSAIMGKLNHKSKLSLSGFTNHIVELEPSQTLKEVNEAKAVIVRKLLRYRLEIWEGT